VSLVWADNICGKEEEEEEEEKEGGGASVVLQQPTPCSIYASWK